MEKKKTKLTISGNKKKPIDNIELAKLQNKNSVVIEKKQVDLAAKLHLRDLLESIKLIKILDLKVILFQQKNLKTHHLVLEHQKKLMTMKNVNLQKKEQQEDLKVMLVLKRKSREVRLVQKKGS